jgi:hypothetical protein
LCVDETLDFDILHHGIMPVENIPCNAWIPHSQIFITNIMDEDSEISMDSEVDGFYKILKSMLEVTHPFFFRLFAIFFYFYVFETGFSIVAKLIDHAQQSHLVMLCGVSFNVAGAYFFFFIVNL